jgi:ATPase family associated with various cellular activities (AAA)/Winged helix domain, variant
MKMSADIASLASVTEMPSWAELNRQWLVAEIGRLVRQIEAPGADAPDDSEPIAGAFMPALIRCATVFGLSAFERQLLLLVAGLQLDGRLREAVAARNPDGSARATFALALAALPQPHWDALSPEAPLRHWRIVEPEPGAFLTQATLHVDERILHFVAGIAANDAQLAGIGMLIAPDEARRGGEPLTERMARALASADEPAAVVLHGGDPDPVALRDAALAALATLGCPALWLAAHDLPGDAATLSLLARHVDREAALTGALPILSLDGAATERAAAGLAARLRTPLIWLGSPGLDLAALPRNRRVLRFELPAADALRTRDRLLDRWRRQAPDQEDGPVRIALERAAGQFHLGPAALDTLIERLAATPPSGRAAAVWPIAREAARGGLDTLAQRIDSKACFDDLVLPDGHIGALRDIARHLRHRERVYRDWGFGEKHALGQGLVALFAGESGTGKTLAAEAIANAVELDLYRVDLAMLVSKYIGETEKNLKSLFDAAETSGAVLLFDEADALFGKRSEVRDSHDRYANIEVAYLLQRIEAYRGLAVLTTNMKSAIDRAFLRRIRFLIGFPFPDAAAREQIWRRQFPAAAPVGDVDYQALARLSLAGGNIRSIALGAAFKAADAGGCIDQAVLIDAARAEFAKLERPFQEAR